MSEQRWRVTPPGGAMSAHGQWPSGWSSMGTRVGITSLLIAPGTNRFPITVMTTYLACRRQGPVTTEPACTPTGMPRLPQGRDDAVLVGSGGLALPEPRPVPVTHTTG
jgi:hypothetical protein